jgi:simple sugar transport system permease protein
LKELSKKNSFLNAFLQFKSLGVLVIFVVLVVLMSIFSPENNFIRAKNIQNLLSFGSEFGIIVLGAGMLMIAGEFDLSVGSVLAFSSFIFGALFRAGMHPLPAFIITLAGGGAMGALNGIITVKGRILSFVTTLGTMMLWRGLTLLATGGTQFACDVTVHPAFTAALNGKIGGYFPVQALWFLFFAVLLYLLLHRHKFGNWVYATGDNKLAARAMCIRTDIVKILSFVIVGVLVAFSSVIQISRVASFSSRVGTGWELRVIAAAVVGGTSLLGGRGSMIGIFLGALIIIVIENALTIMRLPYEWTFSVYGAVILLSALLDLFIEKKKLKYA